IDVNAQTDFFKLGLRFCDENKASSPRRARNRARPDQTRLKHKLGLCSERRGFCKQRRTRACSRGFAGGKFLRRAETLNYLFRRFCATFRARAPRKHGAPVKTQHQNALFRLVVMVCDEQRKASSTQPQTSPLTFSRA
ncbi:hypothetical protein D6817_01045, partial [Candidatus Pacearchaeota archaeon]